MMSWDSYSLTCLSTAAKDAAARGNPNLDRLCEACENITRRLLESSPVDALDAITPERSDRSFDALAKDVRRSIEESEPEVGLDRLHTYVTKQIRILAEGRGVTTARDRPLHSIFGEYLKVLRRLELIERRMHAVYSVKNLGTALTANPNHRGFRLPVPPWRPAHSHDHGLCHISM
jgi:hypothetical protein